MRTPHPPVLPRHVVTCCLMLAAGCGRAFEGAGDLRAQRVLLEREVEGLREVAAALERGKAVLPADDILVSVHDSLVRDLLAAQLPFESDADRFHLRLVEAEVQFRGSPIIRLRGHLNLRERPTVAADVIVIATLADITIDQAASRLVGRLSADHLTIVPTTGLTGLLSGSTLDEVARLVRLEVGNRLPTIQIPVKLQQQFEFAALTAGPVRIDGARLAMEVAVSQVMTANGYLWIAVRVTPGDFVKVADAPPAGDASAAEAGVALEDVPSPPSAPAKKAR